MQQTHHLKVLSAAVDIMNSFTFDAPEQSVTEIAKKLGMHKSKVSRLLSFLASARLVTRCPMSKKYHLGTRILFWSNILFSTSNLRIIARPYIVQLRNRTNESVSLFVREGDYRVCIEELESSQVIRMVAKLGELLPLHAGAGGKLLLAYMPEGERKNLIERTGLTRFTPNTITSRKELEEELDAIRKRGIASSFEERLPFAATISGPIRSQKGEVVAALSISGPVPRLTTQKVEEFSVLLRQVTDRISEELGYYDNNITTNKDIFAE